MDYFFDLAFLLELVSKLIGFGFKLYVKDYWNIFDAIIVIFSVSDYIVGLLSSGNDTLMIVFQFLRILRLMRIMKIARYFKGMRSMLKKTSESLREIWPFAALLTLFIYLFALIGRELFAYRALINDDDDFIYMQDEVEAQIALTISEERELRYPRINFNDIAGSMASVLILINGEDWTFVAQDWIRAYGQHSKGKEAIATTYFFIVMLFGNLTLFSLFTGMLLHTFKRF